MGFASILQRRESSVRHASQICIGGATNAAADKHILGKTNIMFVVQRSLNAGVPPRGHAGSTER